MKRAAILLTPGLMLALVSSCEPARRAGVEGVAPVARASLPPGTFTLFVSNQSFDRPTVDIAVTIDGAKRFIQDFEVKNQHNWIPFTFDLAPGSHELRAVSERGETRVAKTFSLPATPWAVLDYWCCDQAFDEPRFALDFLDRRPGFG